MTADFGLPKLDDFIENTKTPSDDDAPKDDTHAQGSAATPMAGFALDNGTDTGPLKQQQERTFLEWLAILFNKDVLEFHIAYKPYVHEFENSPAAISARKIEQELARNYATQNIASWFDHYELPEQPAETPESITARVGSNNNELQADIHISKEEVKAALSSDFQAALYQACHMALIVKVNDDMMAKDAKIKLTGSPEQQSALYIAAVKFGFAAKISNPPHNIDAYMQDHCLDIAEGWRTFLESTQDQAPHTTPKQTPIAPDGPDAPDTPASAPSEDTLDETSALDAIPEPDDPDTNAQTAPDAGEAVATEDTDPVADQTASETAQQPDDTETATQNTDVQDTDTRDTGAQDEQTDNAPSDPNRIPIVEIHDDNNKTPLLGAGTSACFGAAAQGYEKPPSIEDIEAQLEKDLKNLVPLSLAEDAAAHGNEAAAEGNADQEAQEQERAEEHESTDDHIAATDDDTTPDANTDTDADTSSEPDNNKQTVIILPPPQEDTQEDDTDTNADNQDTTPSDNTDVTDAAETAPAQDETHLPALPALPQLPDEDAIRDAVIFPQQALLPLPWLPAQNTADTDADDVIALPGPTADETDTTPEADDVQNKAEEPPTLYATIQHAGISRDANAYLQAKKVDHTVYKDVRSHVQNSNDPRVKSIRDAFSLSHGKATSVAKTLDIENITYKPNKGGARLIRTDDVSTAEHPLYQTTLHNDIAVDACVLLQADNIDADTYRNVRDHVRTTKDARTEHIRSTFDLSTAKASTIVRALDIENITYIPANGRARQIRPVAQAYPQLNGPA